MSMLTYKNGQALIKKYGLYAAARHLKNLGFPLAVAVEYLALKPTHR